MKHTHKYLGIPIILALVLASMPVKSAHAAGVRYAADSGTGDCSSWANACTLQEALSGAVAGDEIWVKLGTHNPTTSDPDPRKATFQLKSGVAVYGGFAGTETARDERKPAANPTILSGDLNGDDVTQNGVVTDTEKIVGSNAYRVVTAIDISESATLDGFIITGGNNDQLNTPAEWGGGLYAKNSDLVIQNVRFEGNRAAAGGGMFINGDGEPVVMENVEFYSNTATVNGGGLHTYNGSDPILTNVTISGNTATGHGGGMYNVGGSPSLTNVTLSGNKATNGGGMGNWDSSPSLMYVTLSDNQATYGGGMYNWDSSSPSLTKVTLSGNQATSGGGGIYNHNSAPTLVNVTFSGNQAVGGGGMRNDNSSPSLTNVTMSGNSATNLGGGMYNIESAPILTNVTLSGNQADEGGGMYNQNSSSPSLTNVTISGNWATYAGGGMYNRNSSSPSLTNVTLSGNGTGLSGGGMYNSDSSPSLTNVTLSGNYAADAGGGMFNTRNLWTNNSLSLTNVTLSGNSAGSYRGGGMFNYQISPNLTNVIIADSPSGGDCVIIFDSLDPASANNLIEDPKNACDLENGSKGNIIGIDPNLGPLVNHGGWTETHALLPGSPAIDAVTNGGCPGTDQRGVARPQGSQCDIGAYEFYTGIYYAKPTASGAGNCSSWADACRLQIALDTVVSGDEIWAMAGTHKPTNDTDRTISFQLKSGVGAYGGFAGTETSRDERDPAANLTILSGDLSGDDGADFANNDENSYHVVTGSGTDSSAILDGFTVRGGNANDVNLPHDSGGGMYNDSGSPSVTNVTFSGNQAYFSGGGMYNENSSSPSLTNVTLSGNQASSGGGMGNWDSSPSLTNVTLSGNKAIDGGGMTNDASSPSLTNVTLSGNQADEGGGMYNNWGSPTLTNVTLSGNQADEGGGINNNWGSPTLTNVIIANSISGGDCVKDNFSSLNSTSANNLIEDADKACGLADGEDGNIIGADPMLSPLAYYGGWTETQALQPGSPAINAGSDSSYPSTDQRGVTRPQGSHCDIGAVEFQGTIGSLTTRSQGKYDGWVLESGEFTGKGGQKNNLSKVLQVGDDPADKQFRTILSFGTAGIPDYAVITMVTLKVKKAGVTGTDPMSTHNSLVVDIKKSKFSTLPTLQINDFQAAANKLKAGKFPKTPFSGLWYRAVLYKGAHAYINVKGRTQLRLRFTLDDNNDNGADILKLFSGNAILANRPQLIVEYYVP